MVVLNIKIALKEVCGTVYLIQLFFITLSVCGDMLRFTSDLFTVHGQNRLFWLECALISFEIVGPSDIPSHLDFINS